MDETRIHVDFKDALRQARLYITRAMMPLAPVDIRYKELNEMTGKLEAMILKKDG